MKFIRVVVCIVQKTIDVSIATSERGVLQNGKSQTKISHENNNGFISIDSMNSRTKNRTENPTELLQHKTCQVNIQTLYGQHIHLFSFTKTGFWWAFALVFLIARLLDLDSGVASGGFLPENRTPDPLPVLRTIFQSCLISPAHGTILMNLFAKLLQIVKEHSHGDHTRPVRWVQKQHFPSFQAIYSSLHSPYIFQPLLHPIFELLHPRILNTEPLQHLMFGIGLFLDTLHHMWIAQCHMQSMIPIKKRL